MPKTLMIHDEPCFLVRETYNKGGRTALALLCQDGSPYCVATINEPDITLAQNEVILKTRDGQEAAIAALMAAGIVSQPLRHVSLGYATEPVVSLNETVIKDYVEGEDPIEALDPSSIAADDADGYEALGPDGYPISPETYSTAEAAQAALSAWVRVYERQGYYSTSSGHRIPYQDILKSCRVEPSAD